MAKKDLLHSFPHTMETQFTFSTMLPLAPNMDVEPSVKKQTRKKLKKNLYRKKGKNKKQEKSETDKSQRASTQIPSLLYDYEGPYSDIEITGIISVRKAHKKKHIFQISCRTAISGKQIKVSRRYRDFVWLRESLSTECPYFVIPKIPKKFTSSKFLTKTDEEKSRFLQKFLVRIARHPVVSHGRSFELFFESPLLDKQTQFDDQLSNTSILGYINDYIRNSPKPDETIPNRREKELSTLQRASNKIRDLSISLIDLEQKQVSIYRQIAQLFEDELNSQFPPPLGFETISNDLAEFLEEKTSKDEQIFAEPLNELSLQITSCRDCLNEFEKISSKLQKNQKDFDSRKQKCEKVTGNSTKESKFYDDFLKSQNILRKLRQDHIQAVTQVSTDLHQFDAQTSYDYHQLFDSFSTNQLSFEKTATHLWSHFLDNFEK
ncbi:sorting nexin [Anaeramoeba ignava]|uniref:Sorting nexin n=1 Tax=Anaeramoeba ignava TaxID=1746090 RepID=A0A9Q0LPP6_ANAIG|nr:sorting nexin [Anaeramoeba ignava]